MGISLSCEPNRYSPGFETMTIFVIYAHKPVTAPCATINIAQHFDFSLDKSSNRIVLTGRNNGPAIDFRSSDANVEIMNYDFGHLTIDTAIFMKWIKEFVNFCDRLNTQLSPAEGQAPFHELLRAMGTFMACDNGMTNKIASDFVKWSDAAENYGTDNFVGGYRHMQEAFLTARTNGAVWIKHFPKQ